MNKFEAQLNNLKNDIKEDRAEAVIEGIKLAIQAYSEMFQSNQTVSKSEYTKKEACEVLNISQGTLYNWINAGYISSGYTRGKKVLFKAETIHEAKTRLEQPR